VLNCEDIEREKTIDTNNKLTPVAPKSLETKLRCASKTIRTRSFLNIILLFMAPWLKIFTIN